jgi:hypothetical protein
MLVGVLVVSLAALSWVRAETGALARHTAAVVAEPTVGPFHASVERFVIHRDESGRPEALVQLHLWRPGGAVPFAQRVNVAGVGDLDTRWQLRGSTWLIRNEYLRTPQGDSLFVAGLGNVPATHNAGEARGVFRFSLLGSSRRPCPVSSFSFTLPSGEVAHFGELVAEER